MSIILPVLVLNVCFNKGEQKKNEYLNIRSKLAWGVSENLRLKLRAFPNNFARLAQNTCFLKKGVEIFALPALRKLRLLTEEPVHWAVPLIDQHAGRSQLEISGCDTHPDISV